jgi:hypothetical protein
MNEIDQIQACEYLDLHAINETEGNSLRLVVHEQGKGELATAADIAREPVLAGARSIQHGPGHKVFELVWDQYVGYVVLNESFATGEPKTSIRKGRLLVEYTSSLLLDHFSHVTWASGTHRHWALFCQDHVVEVVATEPPRITVTVAE